MKYYTPSIDEFHHNLLYEELINGEWKPVKFKLKILPNIFDTRIKYLDEDDIIDLGFRLERSSRNTMVFIKEIPSIRTIEYVELSLTFVASEPYVSLYQDEMVIFSELNIKNVAELKWLLTRYGLV